jgi:hypothetical protein
MPLVILSAKTQARPTQRCGAADAKLTALSIVSLDRGKLSPGIAFTTPVTVGRTGSGEMSASKNNLRA